MARLTIIGLVLLILVSCSEAARVQPTSTPTATARPTMKVWLRCEECAEIGMEINLWKTASRAGVSGSVPHDTQAIVLDTEIYQGVLHYRVKAKGITGWVSELFVEK